METFILLATLFFAALAAVAAAAAARWEWLGLSQHVWRYKTVYTDPGQGNRVDVTAHAEGAGLFYNVRAGIYGPAVKQAGDWQQASAMARGSDPFELTAFLDSAEKGDAWVEIRWITFRPRREHGERINLNTGEFQEWKWLWRSLRVNPRPGDRRWKMWPHRTRGEWRTARKSPRAQIPTEGTGIESLTQPWLELAPGNIDVSELPPEIMEKGDSTGVTDSDDTPPKAG